MCQNYDGASVMSGHLSGVQAQIRKLTTKALYFHCYCHRLNLVIVDCIKSVPAAAEFFVLLEALYVL